MYINHKQHIFPIEITHIFTIDIKGLNKTHFLEYVTVQMKRKLDMKRIHTFPKCTLRFVLFLFILKHLKQHFKTAFDLRVIVHISKSDKNVTLPKLRAAVSKVVDEFDKSTDGKIMHFTTYPFIIVYFRQRRL